MEAIDLGEKFDPAHSHRLLDPTRRIWNNPEAVVGHMLLGPGMTVADVGCGPGYFTLPLASQVGPTGAVYAIDVQSNMLTHLESRAAAAAIQNIRTVLAEAEDEYPIPTGACDAALVACVYHETDTASNFLGELRRILKPGGVVLLLEWHPRPTPIGPPLNERLSPTDVADEFLHVGFVLDRQFEVGPYHYGLRFRATSEPG